MHAFSEYSVYMCHVCIAGIFVVCVFVCKPVFVYVLTLTQTGGKTEFDEFIDFKRQHLFTDTHIHIYIYTRVLSRDS